MKKKFTLALAGNPNCGKSSIFNYLTGLNQKVGNYPGVTVDKKTGSFTSESGVNCEVIDLPGTYSLHPISKDELVVTDYLIDSTNESKPDAILYVADCTQLDKQLLLLSQIIDLGYPCAVILTMSDLKVAEGIEIDIETLRDKLNIPIEEVSIRGQENEKAIHSHIHWLLENYEDKSGQQKIQFKIPEYANEPLKKIRKITGDDNKYRNWLRLVHTDNLPSTSSYAGKLKQICEEYEINATRLQIEETMSRYEKFPKVIQRVTTDSKYQTVTDRIDSVLTNRFLGPIIFFGAMFLLFQFMFSWSGYPMELIEKSIELLSNLLASVIPEGIILDFLIDGLLAGIGGVVIFIPQITILFFLLSIFEEVGYMSRVVYLFDKILSRFGLNGRSLIAFISSGACAVPAIMATRTISNSKERLITIMTSPLISCSARLPVYALLVSFIVPKKQVLGIFNLQGISFMYIYIFTTVIALLVSYILKKILKSREKSFLMIALPVYRKPNIKAIFVTVYEKVKIFIQEAGKIILIASIVIWVLGYFSPIDSKKTEEEAVRKAQEWNYSESDKDNYIASQKFRSSYLGYAGRAIEPIMKPLGYDWKISIGVLASFAAREVFVSTLSTIYSVEESEGSYKSMHKRMNEQHWEGSKKPVYTLATVVSLLLFYMFAMQCMSTIAIVKRETKSWKWPIIQFGYMTALAYFSALIAYQVLT